MATKTQWGKGGVKKGDPPPRAGRTRTPTQPQEVEDTTKPNGADKMEANGNQWWAVVTSASDDSTRHGPWSSKPKRTLTTPDGQTATYSGDDGEPELTIVLANTLSVIVGSSEHFNIQTQPK